MDALRQLYAKLGFTDITSYIQSGNVIFKADSTDTKQLEESITNNIYAMFGWIVPVLVLTVEELKNTLDNNPFMNDTSKDPAFIHLTFLSEMPDSTLLNNIPTGNYTPDEFYCSGKTVYLYCPAGYGNTKLNNTFFENKLKVTATTRNLRTSKELFSLAQK